MWRKKALSRWHGKYLESLGFGGYPELFGEEEFPGHPARGSPKPAGDLGDWNTGRLLAPDGGRAAQRTLRNRRDGVARLGEAAASHTCSGLVLLCPKGQNPARTDTPSLAVAIPASGPGVAWLGLSGGDGVRRRPNRAASLRGGLPRGKLPVPPHRFDQRHPRPVRQVHVGGSVEQ